MGEHKLTDEDKRRHLRHAADNMILAASEIINALQYRHLLDEEAMAGFKKAEDAFETASSWMGTYEVRDVIRDAYEARARAAAKASRTSQAA